VPLEHFAGFLKKQLCNLPYKTDLTLPFQRWRGPQAPKKKCLTLCSQLLDTVFKDDPALQKLDATALVRRLLTEQADLNTKEQQWKAQAKQRCCSHVPASCLMILLQLTVKSSEVTDISGYVANITETCSEKNHVQFTTDYTLEKKQRKR